MTTISLYDAKAKLSRLVSEAERGAEFVITRHGKPVARIAPLPPEASGNGTKSFTERLRELHETMRARGQTFTSDEIIEMKNEGRR